MITTYDPNEIFCSMRWSTVDKHGNYVEHELFPLNHIYGFITPERAKIPENLNWKILKPEWKRLLEKELAHPCISFLNKRASCEKTKLKFRTKKQAIAHWLALFNETQDTLEDCLSSENRLRVAGALWRTLRVVQKSNPAGNSQKINSQLKFLGELKKDYGKARLCLIGSGHEHLDLRISKKSVIKFTPVKFLSADDLNDYEIIRKKTDIEIENLKNLKKNGQFLKIITGDYLLAAQLAIVQFMIKNRINAEDYKENTIINIVLDLFICHGIQDNIAISSWKSNIKNKIEKSRLQIKNPSHKTPNLLKI